MAGSSVSYEHRAKAISGSDALLRISHVPLIYMTYPADLRRWRHCGAREVQMQQALDTAFVNHLKERHDAADGRRR